MVCIFLRMPHQFHTYCLLLQEKKTKQIFLGGSLAKPYLAFQTGTDVFSVRLGSHVSFDASVSDGKNLTSQSRSLVANSLQLPLLLQSKERISL